MIFTNITIFILVFQALTIVITIYAWGVLLILIMVLL